jgi:predicted outer membrane repeat protein
MGGGIAARRTLRVERSIVTRNHARGFGGGIDSNSSDPVIVIGSLIADNTSEHHVGGVAAGTLYMQRSTVRGNTAGDSAGGLFAIVARINASTISGNAGRNGGGILIANSTDPSAITNTTISGNTATLGGGILTEGRLTIRNATISGNVTSGAGAGVAVVAGTLDLISTIVAGNRAGTGGNISGSVASKLASIVGVPAGLTLADILSPAGLADNGGPTRTIALTDSARNPAIGKGDAATCAATPVSGVDQRGEPRTPPCDIGAYEVQ